MVVGSVILAIALTDNLIHLLIYGEDRLTKSEIGASGE
jgi:hypothetical protein